jgi:GH24 family phage-related lysozyme (muramidase)
MTPQEENARIQQQVNEELRAYSEAQRIATKETEKSAEIEAKAANLTATGLQILEKLYNAQLQYTIAMAKGQKGASQFNAGIDAMTEATQIAAVALSLLVPGGALIKGVVAGLTFLATQAMKTAAEMQKAANDQADATYKAFQAFSKAGATGADGLKGFFDDVNRMRLNVNQLDAMAGVIANSAKDMASMGGSVAKARGQFANLVQGMGDFETGMLNLGLSYDDQAEAAMGFMKLQSNLSQGQQRDYGKLTLGMKKYLEETEALARVTGMNRKEQEAAQEKYMSQQRFGAKVQQLRDEGQNEAADLLVSQMKKYAAKGDMFAQAFADSTTGMLTSDASIKGLMSSNGKILEEANAITSGRIKTEKEANESFQQTMGSVKDVTKSMNMLYQAGVGEDLLLPFKEGAEITKAANQNFAEQIEDASKEVKKLINSTDEVDGQLKRYNALIKSQNDEMLALQASLNGAFSSAGVGLQGFTEILENTGAIIMELGNKALGMVREILGIEGATQERLETESQDELNTSQATMGEAVAMAPAKIIEAAGDIAALGIGAVNKDAGKAIQNVVDTAKKERVASDTEYLKQKPAAAAKSQTLGFGPGFKAPTTAADYAELERQRQAAKAAPAPVAAPVPTGGKPVAAPAAAPVPTGGKPAAAAAPVPAAPAAAPPTPGGKTGGPGFPASAPGGGGPAQSTQTAQPASNVTTYSDRLLDYIKKTERFTAKAFWDKKQYTNGYGTKALNPEEVVSKIEAENRLKTYLQNAVSNVISYGKDKKYQWTQGQIDALTSFAYNGGIGMLDQLTQGGKRTNDQIAQTMMLYNKATDIKTGITETLPGLTTRRAEELAMFQARDGGIFDGPKSGYAATLHGNEAVIPLKDGAVPVTMSKEFNKNAANLDKLVQRISMPSTPDNSQTENMASSKLLKTMTEYLTARDSGVFDGPKSRYSMALPSPESLIPLKDGAVPVSMSQEFNTTATNLGELVNIMKNNVGMQSTMLAVLEDMRRSQSNTADNTSRMAAVASN